MPYLSKQMIVMRRDLHMRKGKIAAQAGHACVEAVLLALAREGHLGDVDVENGSVVLRDGEKPASPLSDWFRAGVAKICVYVDGEEALLAVHRRAQEAGVLSALIQDAGCTEFHGIPTWTCLALEPLPIERADAITGELPLF